MKICYLLESTDLWGGVRVVFDQARALQALGHDVVIRSLRGDHRWYPHQVSVEYVAGLADAFPQGEPGPDVVVATFWTTVKPALAVSGASAYHLCQLYESDVDEYRHLKDEIDAVYRLPIPKITIGPWLSDRLIEVFGTGQFTVHDVGQIVDIDTFRPPPAWQQLVKRPGRMKEILVVGLYEASFKGIPDALRAVAILRKGAGDIRLVRATTADTRQAESHITPADEYHVHLVPSELARLYQRADLFIAPSWLQEGFGLPFAEALACGAPCVATAIPSFLSFDERHDYACFVPERDPAAIAAAAARVLGDGALGRRLRKRGPQVVRNRFRGEIVAQKLDALFRAGKAGR